MFRRSVTLLDAKVDRPLRADYLVKILGASLARRVASHQQYSTTLSPPPAPSPLLQLLRLDRWRYCDRSLEQENKDEGHPEPEHSREPFAPGA
jgi:hypothetical protein